MKWFVKVKEKDFINIWWPANTMIANKHRVAGYFFNYNHLEIYAVWTLNIAKYKIHNIQIIQIQNINTKTLSLKK
jgi:hypothetical protein